MRTLRAAFALGVAGAAYAVWEARAYRLGVETVPLAVPSPALDILHISDTHMTGRTKRMAAFLEDLPGMLGSSPDLVIATGDLIDDDSGIDPIVKALSGLDARLGRFYVLGSHDHYQSTIRGAIDGFRKFYSAARPPVTIRRAQVDRLEEGLRAGGWTALTNTTAFVDDAGGRVRLTGLDDPFMRRHRIEHVGRTPEDAAAIGFMHTPEELSRFALEAYTLVLAGHTHGGQVRLPFAGALVTNCNLPTGMARGLHRLGGTFVHISPGLGTSKFSPIRFLCLPEVTLLRLRAG